MSLLRINRVIQSDVPTLLFDLFHGGKVSLGGQVLWLNEPVLPVPVKRADHIEWQFPKPIKVETPGPNSQISVVKQYRDTILLEVWPWATITIRVQA